MAEVKASASRSIAAPAEKVYEVVGDLSRRRELLPASFQNVTVTDEPPTVRYRLHAGGRERDYAMRQVPGGDTRSWREEDEGSSLVTQWTLTPGAAGETTVAIATSWQGAGGIGGFFERTFAPRGVRKLHHQTLENLASVLTSP